MFAIISAKFIQKTPKKLTHNEECPNLEIIPRQNQGPKAEQFEILLKILHASMHKIGHSILNIYKCFHTWFLHKKVDILNLKL